MKILNLTQHDPTPEQIERGVVNLLPAEWRAEVLTFNDLPQDGEVQQRAERIARRAAKTGFGTVMIGGAPFLMAPLVIALKRRGIKPVFAFSRRESVEKMAADGAVTKTQVFRHLGFVEG